MDRLQYKYNTKINIHRKYKDKVNKDTGKKLAQWLIQTTTKNAQKPNLALNDSSIAQTNRLPKNAKLNEHWKIRSFKTKNLKIRFIKIKHCLQIIGENKNYWRTNPSYKYKIDV